MTDHDSDVLVSPEWLESNLDRFESDDPDYRLVEADREFETAYAESHVPGAVGVDWDDDLQDSLERDLLKREAFEETLGEAGITEDTTVVLYGDESNQWAAYTYWQFRYWGHDDVRLLDGGRPYWTDNDLPLTDAVPEYTTREYDASGPYGTFRIFRDGVREALDQDVPMVDVRSAEEFRGEIVAPEGSAETARRAGHIPGATHVSWTENYDDEGRFKSADELRDLYREYGVEDDREVVTYCRIGERSSLTWFALHELLDFEAVRNYDGSWTEWGSLIRAPVEADVDDPAP
ncbi:rhodanese-like domain-containing protein [Halomarina oriensis]|uniref:Sulfurtransferase n=1 Tax=Halomarina oriensis TaxID=671145 RepID=A0A6B0GJU0_9EURY|nr:sulfurtransferase [Halomarina oriensis]